jgi:hypothetical protein
MLAGVALAAAAACSDSGAEEWIQKCVLNGRERAPCECIAKELKPEWRDMALLNRDAQVDAHIGAEAFAARSNALSKCVPAEAS